MPAMPPTLREKKASRITTACNACRSRKQKCGGQRPVCAQCLEYNRPCDWPEQLKRGPAKGYIEALEHRLHETESILLRVLSQVSDAQLSTVASPARTNKRSRSKDGSVYNPFSRLGKRGVDYWKNFPLDTAASLRRWQHDCLSHQRLGSMEADSETADSDESDLSTSPPRVRQNLDTSAAVGRNGTLRRSQHEPEPIHSQPPLEFTARTAPPTTSTPHVDAYVIPQDETVLPLAPEAHMNNNARVTHTLTVIPPESRKRSADWVMDAVPGNAPVHLMLDFFSPPQTRGFGGFSPGGFQEPSHWPGAPPVKFQQQFLW
ncbi:hypothetical protein ASPZODRAFT_1762393 [Penicilliopsis zonata CBS 506.65]|uniref:Zn(2)-C6 fungal-type domain-containing protein n=1 Tax=Penicilliopsis zonata CBS 506.65 TaxID=1073090 RepID=A0A1L9SKP0_9EURO|nr:hypothetical protein ASPZODRAFT_1762393 [Penicilliopsis zonata CBS 506.65]OJJ47735.1 hypothetical protein ASPZODRAFT_1762393 [Penicilliopsis zonata CBS 506.65]